MYINVWLQIDNTEYVGCHVISSVKYHSVSHKRLIELPTSQDLSLADWLRTSFLFRNCGGQVFAQHARCLSCLSCCTWSLCFLYIHIRGRLLEQPLYIGIAQNKSEPTSSNIQLERMVRQHSRGKQPFESNQEKQLNRTQRKFVLNSFWTSINSQHRKS